MLKEPVPHVKAFPNPANILEWHYVITGPDDTPYRGTQRQLAPLPLFCTKPRATLVVDVAMPWILSSFFFFYLPPTFLVDHRRSLSR